MQRAHLKEERIRCALWDFSEFEISAMNYVINQDQGEPTILHLQKTSQSIQQEFLVLACFRNWINYPQLRFQLLLKIKEFSFNLLWLRKQI